MGSDAGVVPECHREERAEAWEEALDLPFELRSKPSYHCELLVGTEISKSQIRAATFHTTSDTYPTFDDLKLLIPESTEKVRGYCLVSFLSVAYI